MTGRASGFLPIVLCLLLLVTQAAEADLLRVPTDQPSISRAITAASDGDTILVAPGTYREFIDFQGKSITVASLLFIGEAADTPARTIIEAPAPGQPVVSLVSGEDRRAILYGFTIRGGSATDGGGLLCRGSSPTILHNIIEDNRATAQGGGICLLASRAAIRYNRLNRNRATGGGGLHVGTGSEPRIHFNEFNDNQAEQDGGAILLHGNQMAYARGNDLLENRARRGGGLAVTGGADFLFHSNLAGGNSAAEGGGIYVAATGKAFISSNTIQGNEAVDGGGCTFTSAGDRPATGLLRDNRIHGNLAAARGGGLVVHEARPVVTGNTLMLNSALAEGGAISCSAGRFAGRPGMTMVLKDNLVAGNMGLGAVVCDHPGLFNPSGNHFLHNQGGDMVGCGPLDEPGDEPPAPAEPFDSA